MAFLAGFLDLFAGFFAFFAAFLGLLAFLTGFLLFLGEEEKFRLVVLLEHAKQNITKSKHYGDILNFSREIKINIQPINNLYF